MTDVRNVIVIGGGPAGYTAALYAARANLEPLVIEGFNWGGQLMITSDVENYPGYADGVLGPAMMQDFRRQAERFGAEFVTDDVTRVDLSQRPFRVWVGDDGIGIRPEHREKIFRVFERLHGQKAYPGTGIGLAIVRKGIERLGGTVGVESEAGRGSRFWFELPKRETGHGGA